MSEHRRGCELYMLEGYRNVPGAVFWDGVNAEEDTVMFGRDMTGRGEVNMHIQQCQCIYMPEGYWTRM